MLPAGVEGELNDMVEMVDDCESWLLVWLNCAGDGGVTGDIIWSWSSFSSSRRCASTI